MFFYTASGTLGVGGTVSVKETESYTSSGTLRLSNGAIYKPKYLYNASGTLKLSNTAKVGETERYIASGSLTLSNSATVKPKYIYSAAGTLRFSNSVSTVFQRLFVYTASGTLRFSNVSIPKPSYLYAIVSGTLRFSNSVTVKPKYIYTITGGSLHFSNSATLKPRYIYSAAGTLRFSNSVTTVFQRKFFYTGTGTLSWGSFVPLPIPGLQFLLDTSNANQLFETDGAVSLVSSSSQFLSKASPSGMVTTSFSIGGWFNLTSLISSCGFIGRWDSGQAQFLLALNGSSQFALNISNTGSNSVLTPGITATTGAWYFVVAWFDSVADSISIQVNNGTVQTTSSVGSINSSSTSLLRIGDNPTSGTPYYNGLMDACFYYAKKLSSTEITQLYNNGAGLKYNQLSGTLTTSLVSYWDFDQPTNLGLDSTGTNSMTGTNSPTFSAGLISGIPTVSGDAVTFVSDLSINQDSASQSTGSSRYVFGSGQIHGKNVLQSIGVSGGYSLSSNVVLSGLFTIYAVVARSSFSNMYFAGNASGSSYLRISSSNTSQVSNDAGSTTSSISYTGNSGNILVRFRRDSPNNIYLASTGMPEVSLGTLSGNLTVNDLFSTQTGFTSSGNEFAFLAISNTDIVTNLSDRWVRQYINTQFGAVIPYAPTGGTAIGGSATVRFKLPYYYVPFGVLSNAFGNLAFSNYVPLPIPGVKFILDAANPNQFLQTDGAVALASASTQYLSTSAFSPGAEGSVSIWLKPSGTQITNSRVFDFGSTSSNFLSLCFGASNALQIRLSDGNASASITLTSGVWYHAVVVWFFGAPSLYVNGSLVGSCTASFFGADNQFYLGEYAGGGSFSFNGSLDACGVWTRTLSTTEIAILYNSGNGLRCNSLPYAFEDDLFEDLTAYYDFDKPANLGYDGVGTNQLTLHNSPTYTQGHVSGTCALPTNWFVGQALSLNGSNQYLSSNEALLSTAPGNCSISVWVNFNPLASDQTIYCQQNGSSVTIELYYSSSDNVIYWSMNGGTTKVSTYGLSSNTWYHIVGTFDGSLITIYINSDEWNQIPSPYPSASSKTYIGCYNGASNFLDGYIDGLGLWNINLSQQQVTELYNEGSGLLYSQLYFFGLNSYLVSYYEFDNPGDLGADAISRNTLTLNNSPGYVVGLINGSTTGHGDAVSVINDLTTNYDNASQTTGSLRYALNFGAINNWFALQCTSSGQFYTLLNSIVSTSSPMTIYAVGTLVPGTSSGFYPFGNASVDKFFTAINHTTGEVTTASDSGSEVGVTYTGGTGNFFFRARRDPQNNMWFVSSGMSEQETAVTSNTYTLSRIGATSSSNSAVGTQFSLLIVATTDTVEKGSDPWIRKYIANQYQLGGPEYYPSGGISFSNSEYYQPHYRYFYVSGHNLTTSTTAFSNGSIYRPTYIYKISGGTLGFSGAQPLPIQNLQFAFDAANPNQIIKTDGATTFVSASSQSLSIANNTSIQITGDFFISAWVNRTTGSNFAIVVGKEGSTNTDYDLFINSGTTNPIFTVWNTSASRFNATSSTTTVNGTWYHLLGWYDSAGQTVNIVVNGNFAGIATTAFTGTPENSAQPMSIGGLITGSVFSDMEVDTVVIGKPPTAIASLISTIGATLYNLGAGLSAKSITSVQNTAWGTVAGYDFDNPSSLGKDYIGSNTLIANNSPTYVVGKVSSVVALAGDAISLINDLTTHNNNATQTTGTNRFTLQLNEIAGQYALTPITASTSRYSLNSTISLTTETIYVVMNRASGKSASAVSNTSVTGEYHGIYSDDKVYVNINGTQVSAAMNANGNFTLRLRRNAANQVFAAATGFSEVLLGTISGTDSLNSILGADGTVNFGTDLGVYFSLVLVAGSDTVANGSDTWIRQYIDNQYGDYIPYGPSGTLLNGSGGVYKPTYLYYFVNGFNLTNGSLRLSNSATVKPKYIYIGSGKLSTGNSATYKPTYKYSITAGSLRTGNASTYMPTYLYTITKGTLKNNNGAIYRPSYLYTITTGSLKFSNVSINKLKFTFVASSGLITGNGSTYKPSYRYAIAAGSLRNGGSTVYIPTYLYTITTGSLKFSNSSVYKPKYFYTITTGSLKLSNSATVKPKYVYTLAAGTLNFSNAATYFPKPKYVYTGSGTLKNGNGSTYIPTYIYTITTGTLKFSNVAVTKPRYLYPITTGSLKFSNSFSYKPKYVYGASGTLGTSNSASYLYKPKYIYTTSGTLKTGNSSTYIPSYRYTITTGSLRFSNSAKVGDTETYLASGSLKFSNSSVYKLTIPYAASGTLRTSNAATYFPKPKYIYTGSGSLRNSNGSVYKPSYRYTITTGSLRFSNGVGNQANFAYTASGSLRLSNSATVKPKYLYSVSGTLRSSNSASYYYTYKYTYSASGTIRLSNSCKVSPNYKYAITTGSLRFSNSVKDLPDYIYLASGTLRPNNSSTVKPRYLYGASGTLRFSNSASVSHSSAYFYTGSGTLSVGNSVRVLPTYKYGIASGSLRFSNGVKNQSGYSYSASGTLRFSNAAIIKPKYLYVASGTLRPSNSASASHSNAYFYVAGGALKTGSGATYFDRFKYIYNGTGSLKFSNTASSIGAKTYVGSGSLRSSNGVVIGKAKYIYVASGSLKFSNSVIIKTGYSYPASGLLRTSNSATASSTLVVISSRTAVYNVRVAASITNLVRYNISLACNPHFVMSNNAFGKKRGAYICAMTVCDLEKNGRL